MGKSERNSRDERRFNIRNQNFEERKDFYLKNGLFADSEMLSNIIKDRSYLDPMYGGDNALEIALKIDDHLIMLNLLNKK